MATIDTDNYGWTFPLSSEQLDTSNDTLKILFDNVDDEVFKNKYRQGEYSLNYDNEGTGVLWEVGIGTGDGARDNGLNVYANGLVKIPYTFEVTGDSTLGGTATLAAVDVTSTLDVAQAVTFDSTLYVISTIDVDGELTINNDISGTITGGTF